MSVVPTSGRNVAGLPAISGLASRWHGIGYAEATTLFLEGLVAGQRVPLFLFLLCLALGAVIYVEITHPVRYGPPETVVPLSRRATEGSEEPAPPFRLPPFDTYEEVMARPLFSPTRRPPANAAVASHVPKADFTLI